MFCKPGCRLGKALVSGFPTTGKQVGKHRNRQFGRHGYAQGYSREGSSSEHGSGLGGGTQKHGTHGNDWFRLWAGERELKVAKSSKLLRTSAASILSWIIGSRWRQAGKSC